MSHRRPTGPDPLPPWTRRRWLGGVALLALGASGADRPPGLRKAESDLLDAIEARAGMVGVKVQGVDLTAHYFGAGDAPPAFRSKALALCEDLADTFLKHFQFKGFEVALPKDRMAVVTLANKDSYEAFKGQKPGDNEGGFYDVANNVLGVFDFFNAQGANARRLNTFTLVHEAVHQLSYNTGLLDRAGDAPLVVSEGIATYGELWTLARQKLGLENGYRLDVLKDPQPGVDWLPFRQLLTDDDLFNKAATEQLAYAEAWLFAYELMSTKAGARKLQGYLTSIRPRRDAGRRVEDAEAAFGNLDRLDAALRKRANNLLR